MPNVMTTVPTAEQILSMGARSFEQIIRDNGSKFFRIAEGTTAEERAFRLWLADTVQDLHNGELPNDWRYEVIRDLFYAFLDYTEPDSEPWDWDALRDAAWEIAGTLTTPYPVELFKWLADHPNRAAFDDESFSVTGRDLIELATARQFEEIQGMAHSLLLACSSYQTELALIEQGPKP